MSFCIPKNLTEEFRKRFRSGEITPEKLSEMSSEERHKYFASFLGESNAEKVNTLFESKLLLKNQQQGIINWAQNVAGMKPEVQRDIISRVNKMDKVLNPKNRDTFLSDIAAHKLGVTVTMEEAANISRLAKEAKDKRDAIANGGDRMEYGRAKVNFDDYINNLKTDATKKKLSEYLKPQNYKEAFSNAAGFAKSMKASLDNSVIGRQGLKVLLTHPDVWYRNSLQSFKDIWNTFGGKDTFNEVRADVMSRPNALNGLYKKEGLAVVVREEAYPTNLPEKIPGLGIAFKASESAFTGFQYRSRADIFDKLVEIADKTGGDTTGLGIVANTLTGRGKLGSLEPSANFINNVLFSPRLLKSNIDSLTGSLSEYKNLGKLAKKEAALNTLKIISGIAAVMVIAKAYNKDSVEEDPRSSDFGKIRVGDTRFDISGGMSSIAVLASRLATMSSKSSVNKTVSPINSDKFGATTGSDVVYNFFENKLSPAASIIKDILNNKDFQGNKPTVLNEAKNLLMPLGATNYLELKNNPNSANILAAMIADELGIGTNTYSQKSDWSTNQTKELVQFKEQVGENKFKSANDEFNNMYNQWFNAVVDKKEYKSLSEEKKKDLMNEKKKDIKKIIFREYGFRPTRERKLRLPNI